MEFIYATLVLAVICLIVVVSAWHDVRTRLTRIQKQIDLIDLLINKTLKSINAKPRVKKTLSPELETFVYDPSRDLHKIMNGEFESL